MLNPEKYRSFLLSRLKGSKLASGNSEVVTRCLSCPDSKDPKQAHMYFYIPKGPNDVPYYYCQKCRYSGVVTHQKLIEWGIYEDDIALDLIHHLKDIKMTSYNSKYFDREIYIIRNNYIKQDELSANKLMYINNRLGINLTYEDCLKQKIVLNLNDMIQSNHITKLTRNINIVNQLDQNFVGFISLDNAFVNMRRTVDKGLVYESIDKRYVNYSIFNKFDNAERFYTIPKSLNLSTSRRIQLHIAEGPFDILSIYYNLRNQTDDIYTCIAGNNYKGLISKFTRGMRLPNLEIHLYPDNDKFGDTYAMNDIVNFCIPLCVPLYIHRNIYRGEKDFGVPLNKIDERIEVAIKEIIV